MMREISWKTLFQTNSLNAIGKEMLTKRAEVFAPSFGVKSKVKSHAGLTDNGIA